jgi:hypothetical protein
MLHLGKASPGLTQPNGIKPNESPKSASLTRMLYVLMALEEWPFVTENSSANSSRYTYHHPQQKSTACMKHHALPYLLVLSEDEKSENLLKLWTNRRIFAFCIQKSLKELKAMIYGWTIKVFTNFVHEALEILTVVSSLDCCLLAASLSLDLLQVSLSLSYSIDPL